MTWRSPNLLDRERAETAIPQLETIINEAQKSADEAQKSADEAAAAVDTLNGKIKSIVQGAPTVDKAVSVMQTVLEAISEYDPDYDTVDTFFWHDANGAQILDTAGNYILTVDWLGRVEAGDYSGTLKSIFDIFYPVGSYYETSDANFNPNTAWGGTWVLEEEGLVHIGSGANYAIGATGGKKAHNHLYRIRYGMNYYAVVGDEPIIQLYDYETNEYIDTDLSKETGNIVNEGNLNGSRTQLHTLFAYEAHTSSGNNLPPYTVVNRWHRTA